MAKMWLNSIKLASFFAIFRQPNCALFLFVLFLVYCSCLYIITNIYNTYTIMEVKANSNKVDIGEGYAIY